MITRQINWILFLVLAVVSTACLKTRSDMNEEEEKKIMQSQMSQLQRSKADQEANIQNYENQMRLLYGRVETLEHQVTQLSSDNESLTKKLQENDERFKQLEQALLQVEQGQVVALKPATQPEAQAAPTNAVKKKESKKLTPFDEAEEHFEKKHYKKAVVLYQKYRDKNPGGPEIAEATLKIGMCFQEMKMNKEARVFYEEVVEKFPKSKIAKLAQSRLGQLSKKK